MESTIYVLKKTHLQNPLMIEGLPGIGFVANIATLHIIRELQATRFAEVNCSSFQDFAVSVGDGKFSYPINELYYYRGKGKERDLIILYGFVIHFF